MPTQNYKLLSPIETVEPSSSSKSRNGSKEKFEFSAESRTRFIANMLAVYPGKEALVRGMIQIYGANIVGVPVPADNPDDYFHIFVNDEDDIEKIEEIIKREGRSYFIDHSSRVIVSRKESDFRGEFDLYSEVARDIYGNLSGSNELIRVPSKNELREDFSRFNERRINNARSGWIEKFSIELSKVALDYIRIKNNPLSILSRIAETIILGSIKHAEDEEVSCFIIKNENLILSNTIVSCGGVPVNEYVKSIVVEWSRSIRSAFIFYSKDHIESSKWLKFITKVDIIDILSLSLLGDFIKELPHSQRVPLVRELLEKALQPVFDELAIAPARQTALLNELSGRLAEPEAGQAWVERIGAGSQQPRPEPDFPPLPQDRPLVPWSDREKGESPVSFIQRVYGDRMGRDPEFTKAYIRHVDRPLQEALRRWVKDGNELPEGFDLPTKKEVVDRELVDSKENKPETLSEWRRLRQARYRRNRAEREQSGGVEI